MGIVEEEKIMKIFNNFDIYKRGSLGDIEIRRFLEEVFTSLGEDIRELNDNKIVVQLFEIFDSDHNGRINLTEFINLMKFLIDEKGYKLE